MPKQRIRAQQTHDGLEPLSEEDSVWLAERLVEYKVPLEYLHAD